MSIPQDKIFDLLKKLPDEDKRVFNFMEYLYERKKKLKNFWKMFRKKMRTCYRMKLKH